MFRQFRLDVLSTHSHAIGNICQFIFGDSHALDALFGREFEITRNVTCPPLGKRDISMPCAIPAMRVFLPRRRPRWCPVRAWPPVVSAIARRVGAASQEIRDCLFSAFVFVVVVPIAEGVLVGWWECPKILDLGIIGIAAFGSARHFPPLSAATRFQQAEKNLSYCSRLRIVIAWSARHSATSAILRRFAIRRRKSSARIA